MSVMSIFFVRKVVTINWEIVHAKQFHLMSIITVYCAVFDYVYSSLNTIGGLLYSFFCADNVSMGTR